MAENHGLRARTRHRRAISSDNARSPAHLLLVRRFSTKTDRLGCSHRYVEHETSHVHTADQLDVCGFIFREPGQYTPPADLEAFLAQGPPPVYIGFGSIVIDDPQKLTQIIVEALAVVGVRAIVSRGWSKIGAESNTKDIFYLGDCPHGTYQFLLNAGMLLTMSEWLFQRVSAVVHHGGAGTTACGLLNGRPTAIVPFFGDQPFWGKMIATAGAGPNPVPYKELNSENLAEAITFCLDPVVASEAEKIAAKMRTENGVREGVASFHRQLPRMEIQCDLLPQYPASWVHTKSKTPIKLSNQAAAILTENLKVDLQHLKL